MKTPARPRSNGSCKKFLLSVASDKAPGERRQQAGHPPHCTRQRATETSLQSGGWTNHKPELIGVDQ